jgi:glycine/D-amino acid oxidase-like deaminating enzyme
MGLSTCDPIIIVGAGSFGLSAALHLSQRGYTDVSVFGKDEHAPSGDLSIVECSTPLIRWKRY